MGELKDFYDIAVDIIDRLQAYGEKKKDRKISEYACQLNGEVIKIQREIEKVVKENEELKKCLDKREEDKSDFCKISNGTLAKKSDKGVQVCYCPNCYTNGKKEITLSKYKTVNKGYYCPTCGASFLPVNLAEEKRRIDENE